MSGNIYFDLEELQLLGCDSIVGKTVRIRSPKTTSIGNGTIIDDVTYVSASLKTGVGCHIAAGVNISGGSASVVLGDLVAISAGCSLHCKSSDYRTVSMDLPSVPEDLRFGGTSGEIRIADYALLGARSVVLPGVELPEGFACAAHTVIRKRDYEPWTLYGGYDCHKLYPRRLNDTTRAKLRAIVQTLRRCSPQAPVSEGGPR